jgi:EAL domain-containing protein (putative c-di-GMP-specific phosphodiesterase class I)/GGDEF domain-containing protein
MNIPGRRRNASSAKLMAAGHARLTITRAMVLLVALPLLGFGLFSVAEIVSLRERTAAAKQFEDRLVVASAAVNYVTAIGTEWASAAASVPPATGAVPAKRRQQWLSDQKATDRRLDELTAALARLPDREILSAAQTLEQAAGSLGLFRSRLAATPDPTLSLAESYRAFAGPAVHLLETIDRDGGSVDPKYRLHAIVSVVNAFLAEVDATQLYGNYLALGARNTTTSGLNTSPLVLVNPQFASRAINDADGKVAQSEVLLRVADLESNVFSFSEERRQLSQLVWSQQYTSPYTRVGFNEWSDGQAVMLAAAGARIETLVDVLRADTSAANERLVASQRLTVAETLLLAILAVLLAAAVARRESNRLRVATAHGLDIAAGRLRSHPQTNPRQPDDAITAVAGAFEQVETTLRQLLGQVETLRRNPFAVVEGEYRGEWRQLVDDVQAMVRERAMLAAGLETEVSRERGLTALTAVLAEGLPAAEQLRAGRQVLSRVVPPTAQVNVFECLGAQDLFVQLVEDRSGRVPIAISLDEMPEVTHRSADILRVVRHVTGRDGCLGALVVELPMDLPPDELKPIEDYVGAVAAVLSIGVRRNAAEDELETQRQFDPVTGALRPDAFVERLTMRDATHPGPVGIMLIELDRLEHAFQRYGGQALDRIIREVVTRIWMVAGPQAELARLLDFHLLVAVPAADDVDSLMTLSGAIRDRVEEVYSLADGTPVQLKARIAVVHRNPTIDQVETFDQVLRRAQLTLGQTDADHPIVLFSKDLNQIQERSEKIQVALEELSDCPTGLSVYFQPLVDVVTGRISSCEALAVWEHPELGRISPEVFIPMAEANGQIYDLGRLLIEQALINFPLVDTQLAVNVSALELGRPDFADWLIETVDRHNFARQNVVIEVTETSVFGDTPAAALQLRRLRAEGCHVAIDDFGTGFASMAYLRNLPTNSVKIDKLFVRDVDRSEESRIIVSAIVRMARDLNLAVVAEGVESMEELATIRALGATYAQGYLFARPMPALDLRRRFADHPYITHLDFPSVSSGHRKIVNP